MVSEEDTLYIEVDGKKSMIGDGFSSKEDIIEFLKSNYKYHLKQDETIEFGVCEFSKISDTRTESVELQKQNLVELSEAEQQKLDSIVEQATSDDRIVDVRTDVGTAMAEKYQQNLRYEYAVDFSLYIDTELFDDPPVSAYDEDQVEIITRIFNDLASDNADYLGFHSVYASRGRRNPVVIAYGRINREIPKEKQFRELYNKDFVVAHHWNDLNFSPVPISYNTEVAEPNSLDQDYILVLDKSDNTTEIDQLSDTAIESVEDEFETVESETDFRVAWIGKVNYFGNFHQICFGVKFSNTN